VTRRQMTTILKCSRGREERCVAVVRCDFELLEKVRKAVLDLPTPSSCGPRNALHLERFS